MTTEQNLTDKFEKWWNAFRYREISDKKELASHAWASAIRSQTKTDEEIEKEAYRHDAWRTSKFVTRHKEETHVDTFEAGAKWARSQMSQGGESRVVDWEGFTISGTESCPSCEDGRITTFVKHNKCISCDPESYSNTPRTYSPKTKPDAVFEGKILGTYHNPDSISQVFISEIWKLKKSWYRVEFYKISDNGTGDKGK